MARQVEVEIHLDTANAEAAIEDLLDLVRELRAEVESLRAAWPTAPSFPTCPLPGPSARCHLCGAWHYGVHSCWTYSTAPNTWPSY